MIEKNEKITIGLRLASMLVDHFAMTFIVMALVLPGFIFKMVDVFNIDHEPSSFGFSGILFFFYILGFSAYFNKDIFNGRSPAKRILKLQVIDIKTDFPASPLKCLVRNLTIPLWPLEVIFVLINPTRRFGDKIAGTRIDFYHSDQVHDKNWKSIIITILIAVGFSLLITLPFKLLETGKQKDKIAYIQETLNEEESQRANKLFEAKLSGLLKQADFRIYDKIENDNRKYVSAILYFQNRADYEKFESSEQQISQLLTTEFPLDNYLCFLKFVYKESGSMSTSQKFYDSKDIDK